MLCEFLEVKQAAQVLVARQAEKLIAAPACAKSASFDRRGAKLAFVR